ncbi:MAG: preprotein translocase subunit SecE [Prevotella sp.]|jgi:preprotein translocase subunit SecE|nr:preprotein translocase subunit SecE [Prevotella sp.]
MNKFVNYCKLCYQELAHEVTWPSRKELTQSSSVVLVASLIIALAVFAMDWVFKNLMVFTYTIGA